MHNVGFIGKGIGKKRNNVHKKEDIPKYFIEDGFKKKKMHLTYNWRFKFYKQACDYLLMGLEKSYNSLIYNIRQMVFNCHFPSLLIDVTLVENDGQPPEAHRVILTAVRP